MTHPLTDADCKQIQKNTHDIIHPYISYGSSDYGEDPTLLDDLIRAGYDKGVADTLEGLIGHFKDVRLARVIQFLEANKDLSVETALRFIRPVMRLQQQEDS